MVTRICRNCGAISEHQTAAEVKGAVTCSMCGQSSVLLTEKQAEGLAEIRARENRLELEDNNWRERIEQGERPPRNLNLQCPRCRFQFWRELDKETVCPQCHSTLVYDNSGILLCDSELERAIQNSRIFDNKLRKEKFRKVAEAMRLYESNVLLFRTDMEFQPYICPLCRLFYVDKFVTTYEDLLKHPSAIPPFKPCRCKHVFSVEIEVAHPRMRKKPANVDFVDLESVVDAVNAYGLLCTGEKRNSFTQNFGLFLKNSTLLHTRALIQKSIMRKSKQSGRKRKN